MKTIPLRVLLGVTLLLAASCGASPKTFSSKMKRGDLSADAAEQHKTLVAAGDAAFAERGDEARLREAIAKWEQAVKLKPSDWETYAKLARGCYFLADGHLSFQLPDKEGEFLATYERGASFAELGMAALSPDFEQLRISGTKIEISVAAVPRAGVPLMYWYAANLGKWAKFKGLMTTLKHKDKAFKIIGRVLSMDPEFFYGAADRYFGAFYSVAPSYAGGDVDKSKAHFDASIKRAPAYLGTYVLMAENYATKMQDRALFDKTLKFVLEAPEDGLPDVIPEARAEKKKAENLLKKADEFFE